MKQLSSLLSVLALIFAVNVASADDHSSSDNIYGFVYNFNVSNPAGVVEALTEYWSSPLAKKNPATVILRQIVSNGDDPATHSLAGSTISKSFVISQLFPARVDQSKLIASNGM